MKQLVFAFIFLTIMLVSCQENSILNLNDGIEKTFSFKFFEDPESLRGEYSTEAIFELNSEGSLIQLGDNLASMEVVNENGEKGIFFYPKTMNRFEIYHGYFYDSASGCFVYGTLIIGDGGNSIFIGRGLGETTGLDDNCFWS